jgi:hypothetical protein
MRIRRKEEEIRTVVEEYRASGLTRVEYCRRSGVALSTLSNYCRRHKSSGLIRVNVEDTPGQPARFALVLAGGRRIEIGSQFSDVELMRLIRAVEAA